MLKKELLKLIENIGEEASVDEVLSQSDFAKSLISSGLTLNAFKEKINEPDFKSYLDSIKDKHFDKALETWKTNNLDKLVDSKVKELYPEQDPRDTELAQLKKIVEDMKREKELETLKNKAFKIANEKKLPVELVDFCIGQDETSTLQNIDVISAIIAKRDEEIKTGLLKENSYVPPTGGEIGKENPWARDSFNLTKQAQILKENPALAAQLQETAKK